MWTNAAEICRHSGKSKKKGIPQNLLPFPTKTFYWGEPLHLNIIPGITENSIQMLSALGLTTSGWQEPTWPLCRLPAISAGYNCKYNCSNTIIIVILNCTEYNVFLKLSILGLPCHSWNLAFPLLSRIPLIRVATSLGLALWSSSLPPAGTHPINSFSQFRRVLRHFWLFWGPILPL